MQSNKNQLSRRVERLLWLERFRVFFLVSGLLMVILGAGAVLMTARHTPEELVSILATNPKLSWDPFLLLPAPESLRPYGILSIIIGAALTTGAMASRQDSE